jgi:hypothetical protein
MSIKSKFAQESGRHVPKTYNAAPCAFFDGVHDYFNLNEVPFKAKFPGQPWNGPCANIKYTVDRAGSMHSYRYLLGLA